jgi:hypothetical protein
MSNSRLRRSREKNFAALFWSSSCASLLRARAPRNALRPAIYLARRAAARASRRDLNLFCAPYPSHKIVSSLPVRLDETLPKLVEFTQVSSQRNSATRCCLPDVTHRDVKIATTARSANGVPERALDGRQDASHGGAIYMAAKKKTAKKSTKKTGKKASKKSKK